MPIDRALMVISNVEYENIIKNNGLNTKNMINGNLTITSHFGDRDVDLPLISTSVAESRFFTRDHTGIDYVSDGTTISVPGGYWELYNVDAHKIYLQLFGSDVKYSIQHLNPSELSSLTVGTIFGGASSVLASYPDRAYGNASGTHIHVEVTRSLPYNGKYTRQFVNPETLQPGAQLEYQFIHKDALMNILPGYPANFRRY